MIDKSQVESIVNAFLSGTDYELITLEVSADNRILVEVDRYAGVDVAVCEELNHFIQDKLDREVEDYELEVGSVSLTDPFKTLMQYKKHVGHAVEVLTKDGRKLHAELVNVEDDYFEIDTEVLVPVEGKKKKVKEWQTLRFGYGDVKYCKYDLKI